MPFRIDKLMLGGFRSIRRAEVRLGDLNVVIGVNGAGKSNFEDGFELLRAISGRKFQEFIGRRGGAHRILHRGAPRPEELWVDVWCGTTSYLAQLGFAEVDSLVFLSEGFTIGNTIEAKALAAQKDGPFSSSGHAESVLGIYEGVEQDAVRAFAQGMADGLTIAEGVNVARRLGATPPNVCNPAWMAREATALGRRAGLRVRTIDFAQAQRLGMGGLVNVGKGSRTKPCLIVVEHRPRQVARACRNEHVVLVGKTITYDTGGYSLKVNNGMVGMKYDKSGGTNVLGAMLAIARMKLPIRVTALLPAAENMVNGESYRPDDIITMHNGVTVEVTNTDAEGRLVLADALSWACRELEPTAIVDMATLTGGVVVALGHFSAGMFCEHPSLRRRVEEASEATGERVWRLPLWNDHREYMRSPHADILNSNPARMAHPIQGAAFLSYFVDKDVPWCHLDIAGVASVEGANDQFVKGPTGWGVRTLVEMARRWSGG